MIKMYNGDELGKEQAKKKRLMTFWYVMLGVYVAATAGFIVWFCLIDYDDPMLTWIQVIETAITALFAIFSFLFFSLPFGRQRRYVKLLNHLETGLKEFGEGTFLRFEEKIEVREGVDYKQMITEEWSERRQSMLERKVLIDCEKPAPAVNEGDRVMYTTQGNVLVEYQVVPQESDEPAAPAQE